MNSTTNDNNVSASTNLPIMTTEGIFSGLFTVAPEPNDDIFAPVHRGVLQILLNTPLGDALIFPPDRGELTDLDEYEWDDFEEDADFASRDPINIDYSTLHHLQMLSPTSRQKFGPFRPLFSGYDYGGDGFSYFMHRMIRRMNHAGQHNNRLKAYYKEVNNAPFRSNWQACPTLQVPCRSWSNWPYTDWMTLNVVAYPIFFDEVLFKHPHSIDLNEYVMGFQRIDYHGSYVYLIVNFHPALWNVFVIADEHFVQEFDKFAQENPQMNLMLQGDMCIVSNNIEGDLSDSHSSHVVYVEGLTNQMNSVAKLVDSTQAAQKAEKAISDTQIKVDKTIDEVKDAVVGVSSRIESQLSSAIEAIKAFAERVLNFSDVVNEKAKALILKVKDGVISIICIIAKYFIIKPMDFVVYITAELGQFFLTKTGFSSIWEKVKAFFMTTPETNPDEPVVVDGLTNEVNYVEGSYESNFSIPTIMKWLGGGLLAMFTGMFASNALHHRFDDAMRKITSISLTTKAARDMNSAFPQIWDVVYNNVCSSLNVQSESSVYSLKSRVEKFANDYETLLTVSQRGETLDMLIGSDPKTATTVLRLQKEGIALMKELTETGAPTNLKNLFTFVYSEMRNRFNCLAHTQALSGGTRTEPLITAIEGPTGQGKSFMSIPYAHCLAKALGPYEEPAQVARDVYHRHVDAEFYQGWTDQTVITFDDFGQSKDSEMNPNPAFLEIIHLGNLAPYAPNMAHLNDKGRPMTVKAVVLTSNNLDRNKIKSLVEPSAFKRRLDLHVQVTVKNEYSITNSDDKTVVDTSKLKTDEMNLNIYDIKVLSLSSDAMACLKTVKRGDILTYDQFLDYSLQIAKFKAVRTAKYIDQVVELVKKVEKFSIPEHSQGTSALLKTIGVPQLIKTPSESQASTSAPSEPSSNPDEIVHASVHQDPEVTLTDGTNQVKTPLNVDAFEKYIVDQASQLDLETEMKWNVGDYDADWQIPDHPEHGSVKGTVLIEWLDDVVGDLTPHAVHKFQRVETKFTQAQTKFQRVISKLKALKDYCSSWLEKVKDVLKDMWEHKVLTLFGAAVSLCGAFGLWKWFLRGKDFVKVIACRSRSGISAAVSNTVDKLLSNAAVNKVVVTTQDTWNMAKKKVYEIIGNLRRKLKVYILSDKDTRSEGFASGDNLTKYAPRARLEMVKDQAAWSLVDGKVYSNLYKIEESGTDLLHCFFIQGRTAITNRHFLRYMTGNLTLTNLTDEIFHVNAGEIVVTYPEDPKADWVLLSFPKHVREHCTMTQHFVDKECLSRFQSGTVCMPILTRTLTGALVKQLLGSSYGECMDNELHSTDDSTVCLRKYVQHTLNTANGDCGAPVVIQDNSISRKILAIHAVGSKKKSYGQIVLFEELMEALSRVPDHLKTEFNIEIIPNLKSQAGPQFEEENHGEDGTAYVERTGLPSLGFHYVGECDKPVFTPSKSTLVPSVLHGVISDPITAPSVLYDRDENLMHKNLVKCAKQTPAISSGLIDVAVNAVKCELFQGAPNPRRPYRVLSPMEAVTGIEGDEYMGPINRSTSPGYPHILTKLPGMKGKQQYLGKDEIYKLEPEIQKLMEYRIEAAKANIRIPVVWVDTLKDERRPLAKIEEKKTRVFSTGPFDYNLVFRMYFLSFFAHVMENRIDNEQSVGTNVYSFDWTQTARKLQSRGDRVFAGDFQNFDGTLNQDILRRFADVVSEFYDDGPENAQVRRILLLDVYNSIHLCGRTFYGMNHSQPSGNPATTILNSFYNSVASRIVFILCYHEEFNTFPTMEDFRKNVAMVSYGDDNVYNVSDWASKFFNQTTVTRGFARIGMIYTDELKTGAEVEPYRSLEEVTYLKREFVRFDGNMWRAPQKLENILEMLNWIRKSTDDIAATEMIIHNFLLELSLFPESIFQYYCERVVREFRLATGKYIKHLTFREYERARDLSY